MYYNSTNMRFSLENERITQIYPIILVFTFLKHLSIMKIEGGSI